MLGSVVTMTWSFARQDNGLTIRRFIVLPLVGSMSALVVLVFLKAGQVTITSGPPTDALSPFFVSFVGIISGLVSERAYGWIAHIGGNFFSFDEGGARWGVRLKEAMAEAKVGTDDLASYIGVTPEGAASLVDQDTAATLEQQKLISVLLRKKAREIFTDLPPEGIVAALTVPALVGKDQAVVEAELARVGLKLGDSTTVKDPAPAGQVVAQEPTAGAKCAAGSAVRVTVSSGP
jgi:hypothetical protein